ncbi:hypothetical protein GCM10027361_33640 [Erwinia aphidicola]
MIQPEAGDTALFFTAARIPDAGRGGGYHAVTSCERTHYGVLQSGYKSAPAEALQQLRAKPDR